MPQPENRTQKWKVMKMQLEADCTALQHENRALQEKIDAAQDEQAGGLRRQLEKNQALLEGKEMWAQQLTMCILMEEREQARVRNPLFW